MILSFLLLSPIYAICFVSMFAMYRWYLLAGGTLLAFASLALLLVGLEGASGPTTFGIAMLGFPAFVGFVTGLIGRLIVMLTRRFGRRTVSTLAVGAVSFASGPAFTMAGYQVSEWRREAYYAPPSDQCLKNPPLATLGNVALAVPLTPTISVDTGPGIERYGSQEYKSIRTFQSNDSARRFCTEAKKEPIKLAQLSIDFYHATETSPFCKTPSSYNWRGRACSRTDFGKRSIFPDEVNFYAIGQYNASRMLAFDADNVNDIIRLEKSGRGKALTEGITQYDSPNYIFFIQSSELKQKIVARCHKSDVLDVPKSDGLACVTGFRLNETVGTVIEFRASTSTVVKDWERAIGGAKEIWESLRQHQR